MPEKVARSLIALLVLVAAARAAGQEEIPAAADPLAGAARLELAALVDAVLARNPSIEAARHAWRAAVQRVPQATSWADPMVAAAVAPLSVAGDMPFGATVEARQRLPYPGRLRLAGDIARLEALGAEEEIEVVVLDLAHLAAELYHQLYLIERAREVNAEHVRLLGEVQETATARYAAGLAPQQAPLQAEVELTHVVHRDLDLVTERHIVVARLNALLHRPAGSPLPPAAQPPLRDVPAAVVARAGHHGSAAQVAPAAVAELPPRPELAAAAAEIEARRLEVELAGLARRPDLDLMTSYNSMFEGDHRWMIGVAVELPVRRARIAAAEAEAAARLAAAESRRAALADQVRAEVEAASQHLAHTVHIVELYRDRLRPASADQLRAARAGLETGQVDLGTVIEAERNLRAVDLSAVEALVEVSRAQVALDRALGRLPGGGDGAGGDAVTVSAAPGMGRFGKRLLPATPEGGGLGGGDAEDGSSRSEGGLAGDETEQIDKEGGPGFAEPVAMDGGPESDLSTAAPSAAAALDAADAAAGGAR